MIIKLLIPGLILLGQLRCQPDDLCEATPTTFVALVDMSGVRENPDTRQVYSSNFEELMGHVQPCSHLVAARITESSAMESTFLLNEDFPSFRPTTDNDTYRAAEKEQFQNDFALKLGTLTKMVKDTILLSPRIARQTDLFGALTKASDIFSKYPNDRQTLILFSDMEQYSSDYKFPTLRLDDTQINEIIAAENKKARGLPKLQGIKVYVVGAKSADNDRFFAIRNFWLKYFEACGADCRQEDYGTALIKFD